MDDLDDSISNAQEAGKKNLRALTLLKNWCLHANLVRSGGGGLVEAQTGLPIGHMGVDCKFSQKNTSMHWLLENSVYEFYQNNCKSCNERVPVSLPNILEIIGPREKAAEQRRVEREKDDNERKLKQKQRREERDSLRQELSLEETFVIDLLNDLDDEKVAKSDPRLEQLAKLAPETFTRKIIDLLLASLETEHIPYRVPIAKALLNAPLDPTEKLKVAIFLIRSYDETPIAIDTVLSQAATIESADLIAVASKFTTMAVEAPPHTRIGLDRRALKPEPIRRLYSFRGSDISNILNSLLDEESIEKLTSGLMLIIALDNVDLYLKHLKSLIAKLIRRKILFPNERRDSSLLHYLRIAVENCFSLLPEETDKVLHSYLTNCDVTGEHEGYDIYRSAFSHHWNQEVVVGQAQEIAFKRLLWASIQKPDDLEGASAFFMHASDHYAELAYSNFDDLIGAATSLTSQYKQLDEKTELILQEDFYSALEKNNKRTSINQLQRSLVEWAVTGAKLKGTEGIEKFLNIYRNLPGEQKEMRANMIVHISLLVTGVKSFQLILSEWYRALLDESVLVRANAVKAWKTIPYQLIPNIPDLFYESFSLALSDAYVMVHKNAVYALGRRSFPEDKRHLIKHKLFDLIAHYGQVDEQDGFVVECIEVYYQNFRSDFGENKGFGRFILGILLNLKGHDLYQAVHRLNYKRIPRFSRVALKAIQDSYTRSISVEDSIDSIMRSSSSELQEATIEIQKAFEKLKPFDLKDYNEALVYLAVLSRVGSYDIAFNCLDELLASMPVEVRNNYWRLHLSIVSVACKIEHAISNSQPYEGLIKNWNELQRELDKENEARAKSRDIPGSLFFEE